MTERSTQPAPVVVLVDDEPMITAAMASFLELVTDFEVLTFDSPDDALAAVRSRPVDVVVSDFLMPRLNGIELLTAIKEFDPEIPRILLTGYADKENAIRSINEVGLYQYLEKPLDNELLLMSLNNGIRQRSVQRALRDKMHELEHTLRQRDELHARDAEMQRELDWARTVQSRFLPDEVPDLSPLQLGVVFEPSMGVGGDFYDFIPLADDRWALIVVDSAGHGVQAALGTALLKFATGQLSGQDLGPGEILTKMNGILFQGLPRDIPVAAAAVVVERSSTVVRLVGAGLPKPLLVRADGSVDLQPAAGLLLGLVDNDLYTSGQETILDLAEGDCLLVFSDGLTEAQDEGDVFYGEGPLQEDLGRLEKMAPHELAVTLADRALEFGVPEHRDDLTILALGGPAGN